MGFQNLENKAASDEKDRIYALFIGDLAHVETESSTFLTGVEKTLDEVSFTLGDDDEDEDDTDKTKSLPNKGFIIEQKLRNEKVDLQEKLSSEAKRRAHQKQLAEARQLAGLRKFSGSVEEQEVNEKPVFRKFESYRKDALMPKLIVVDRRAETIILPIFGQPVPFHISTLKNVSKSDEQEFVLLRFNFITPGVATGRKESSNAFEDPNAQFVRAVSYRGRDVGRLTEICREINELKRDVSKRETERIEKAGLVVQEDLQEIKGRRPQRLPNVFVRPGLESKKFAGDLEIHNNGLRYIAQGKGDQKIDLVFANMKHLFFQPCEGELIIVLHVQLKDPIMLAKKKTSYIQFYREISDASFDETGNRRRRANYGDEDELAQEQEERRHRQMLNKEFQHFCEKISEMSKKTVEVDVPFRELGFQGVPFRQLVLLQPTTDCLVNLADVPPLVVTLMDVEVAHLERVQFGLKNFDLVFVFKDFSKPVVHINTIPMEQLENVKEWLDSVDIPFTEGPVNLSWPQIMKTINDDPKSFFEDAGGWSFLDPQESEVGADSEESDGFEMEEESGEESSESDSDMSSAVSENSDDSGSDSGDDEEESGEDWDELERKAKMADERKEKR